jgi:sigma-E factor negative regulatory protein RseB
MLRSVVVALALAASWSGTAVAQGQSEALGWLQKMYRATQKLNYTGTFIYQYGEHSETSRVTRLVEGANVYERVETLDGVPREVVRVNDEVRWYLPTTMTVKIDRKQVAKPFPGMLPEQVQTIGAYYNLRKGEVERIAGYDSQSIILEPKDNMRYAHKPRADDGTGMLVKAKTFNEKGEPLEQFFFTDLRIGGRVDREAVRSRYAGKDNGWRVENLAMNEANLAEAGWMMKSLPPGYAKVTEMRGSFGGTPSVAHIVLSDGLAAASVFIEPLAGRAEPAHLGLSRKGAINVYTRKVEDSLVTVVGEMPAEGVRFIANQVEYRKPN